eukprot:TRINITY_DN102286_c0_g1_i1.p1 TRINITY_DN102286_c0_g1~~TRINITY_DN102286_c0_g1_i1.p1  ORF type:complete len:922 (-),score=392.23 TRINITY_DN102286_c0_g1_i1:120-2885(-)
MAPSEVIVGCDANLLSELKVHPLDFAVVSAASTASASRSLAKAVAGLVSDATGGTKDDQFFSAVKTLKGDLVFVVPFSAAPAGEKPWSALALADGRKPLRPGLLPALCRVLTAASIDAVLHHDARASPLLLCRRKQLDAAVAAVAGAGCAVSLSTSSSAVPLVTPPSSSASRRPLDDRFVGLWRSSTGGMRLQVRSGLFAEVSDFSSSDASVRAFEASRYGYAEASGSGLQRSAVVDFQPLARPSAGLSQGAEEAKAREQREGWELAQAAEGRFLALELSSEEPAHVGASEAAQRRGVWLFFGDSFIRLLGYPVGSASSAVAGTICRSLEVLRRIRGTSSVDDELRGSFEVMEGRVAATGRLEISRGLSRGQAVAAGAFFDADDAGVGGDVELRKAAGVLVHSLSDGRKQTWKIREMNFNPFSAAQEEQAEAAASVSAVASGAAAAESAQVEKLEKKEKDDDDTSSSSEQDKKAAVSKKKEKDEKEKVKEETARVAEVMKERSKEDVSSDSDDGKKSSEAEEVVAAQPAEAKEAEKAESPQKEEVGAGKDGKDSSSSSSSEEEQKREKATSAKKASTEEKDMKKQKSAEVAAASEKASLEAAGSAEAPPEKAPTSAVNLDMLQPGAKVKYWSQTVQRWISANVVKRNSDGTFDLDLKRKANPQFIRPADKTRSAAASEPAAPASKAEKAEKTGKGKKAEEQDEKAKKKKLAKAAKKDKKADKASKKVEDSSDEDSDKPKKKKKGKDAEEEKKAKKKAKQKKAKKEESSDEVEASSKQDSSDSEAEAKKKKSKKDRPKSSSDRKSSASDDAKSADKDSDSSSAKAAKKKGKKEVKKRKDGSSSSSAQKKDKRADKDKKKKKEAEKEKAKQKDEKKKKNAKDKSKSRGRPDKDEKKKKKRASSSQSSSSDARISSPPKKKGKS